MIKARPFNLNGEIDVLCDEHGVLLSTQLKCESVATLQRTDSPIVYATGAVVAGGVQRTFSFRDIAFRPKRLITIAQARFHTNGPCEQSFRLHFFRTAPNVLLKDGDPFAVAWGDRLSYAGYIDFGCEDNPVQINPGHHIRTEGLDLYGVLEFRGVSFTPREGQAFQITLIAEQ